MAKKSQALIETTPEDGIETVETTELNLLLEDDDDDIEVAEIGAQDEVISLFEPDKLPDIQPIRPKSTNISSLIKPVSQDLGHLTWLVYGKNGCGKTKFLSSGGEHTLVVDIDDGTLSIRDTNVKKISVKTADDFEDLYWFLASGKPKDGGIVLALDDGEWLCKTIAIDTLTKLQTLYLRSIVLKERATDVTKDVVNPTLQDWGKLGQRMSYWLTAYKNLPVQKLWACQERNNVDDAGMGQGFVAAPDLSKSLRTYVQTEADVIGRMYIKQVERDGKKAISYRMRVGGSEEFVTKDRTNKLKPIMENPKFKELYSVSFNKDL